MNRIVKLLLPFNLLFLMNVSIFKILATFGFRLTMNEKLMLPPCLRLNFYTSFINKVEKVGNLCK